MKTGEVEAVSEAVLLSPALIIGGGAVALDVAARLIAKDVAVSFRPSSSSEALIAAGATAATDSGMDGFKVLVIVDEFAADLSTEEVTALVSDAEKAGIAFAVRLCTIGTGGGGWFRHQFGESSVLQRHEASVAAFEASSVPFATVNAGFICQSFANLFGPITKATSKLPNVIGSARMSFIDAKDVGEGIVSLIEKQAAGKRLSLNGSRAAQFEQLAAFLTMNSGGTTITAEESTKEDLQAQLTSVSGASPETAEAVMSLLQLASARAFENTSDDVRIALGHPEIMLDAFLKENVALFV